MSSILIFPQPWVDYVPTVTGFSVLPTNTVYRYRVDGTQVIVIFNQNLGTSNATTFTISLPFVAATVSTISQVWIGLGKGSNNSADLTTPVLITIDSAATVMQLYTSPAAAAWTASGTRRAGGAITYQIP